MKLHLSTFFLCITILATGQSVPQGIPFQGVARDLEGHPIGNKEIDIRIHLLQEQTTGSLLYVEYHQITTNNLGLFQLVVGQGRATEADFSTVPWSRSDIWLELAIRETGSSTGYEVLSSSQLLSVPYAMHAGSADMMTTDDQNSLLGPFWKTTGNSGSLPQFHFIGTVDAKDLNFRTANQHRLKIKADGNIEILMSLDVAHDLVVNGNSIIEGDLNVNGVLYGDGSGLTNINVNDADADPTNELQNWNNLPGIPPNIDTDATDDFSGNYNDLSNRPSIPSKTSDLLNDSGYITSAADADADPMNELEMPSNAVNGDIAYFYNGVWQKISVGLTGQILTIGSSGMPEWAYVSGGSSDPNAGLSIGDYYQGGIVYYIFEANNDPGYVAGETHGLIVAINDQSLVGAPWGCRGTFVGATNVSIGSGAANTTKILNNCNQSGTAAKLCADYSHDGYTDWFLPSKDELDKIYLKKSIINATALINGGSILNSGWYWNSSENSGNTAKKQNFSFGNHYSFSKDYSKSVRAIRAF